jgi:hypothetical protein
MDKNTAKSLRQALDLLKSGKVKSARSILVEFLKTNPENEQAWYMLSFAVSDRQRQIYSLNQVLKINPLHEKARKRLLAISGKSFNVYDTGEHPQEKVDVFRGKKPEPQDDLLSQRLFGTTVIPEPKQKVTADVVPELKKTAPLPSGVVEEPDTQPLNIRDEIKIKSNKKSVINKLVTKIPRRVLVLFTLCVIAGGVVILLFWKNNSMGNFLPSHQLPEGSSGVATATPTTTPTPTEIGGALPPTWTPIPPEEFNQPYFGSDSIFTLTSIKPPSSEILTEMAKIRSEMLSSRFDQIASIDSIILSKKDFEQLLTDFMSIPGYNEYIEKSKLVYRALGLINPWDDLTNLLPNIWADPNGSIYLPDENAILLESEDFQIIEKYLYAREYAQALINGEVSLQKLGIYPFCIHQLQQCEVLNALIKGDATREANNWLTTYGPADQIWMVNNLEVDNFNLPVQSPAIFLEKDLEFPYTAGLAFVNSLWDQGGESSINAVYESFPLTIEQILHPEKYIKGEQAVIIDEIPLNSALDNSWEEVLNESIGEWLTSQFLSANVDESARITIEEAESAAAGWGGDRTQIYYNDTTDQLVIFAHWTWDTGSDAKEFYSALSDYLNRRDVGAEKVEKTGVECWQTATEVNCIVSESSDVIWFHAPDMDLMDLLLALYNSGS